MFEAACDLETRKILVSVYCNDIKNSVYHELAHLELGNPKHDLKWVNTYRRIGGTRLPRHYVEMSRTSCWITTCSKLIGSILARSWARRDIGRS